MTSEANKAILRRIYEVINTGNLELADELIAADAVEHIPGIEAQGSQALKQFVTMARAAFPDIQCMVEEMIAEGDKVVARFRVRGTHQGEFQGIAATGKQVTVTGMDMVRIAGGKMVEHWGQVDNLGLLQQLGAMPSQ